MAFLNFRFRTLLLAGLAGLFSAGCKTRTTMLTSPPNYNFSQKERYKLDTKLLEISGLAWDPVIDIFYAVNDEVGVLYTMDKESKKIISSLPFGGKGDYEDVALYNGVPYVLRSDGLLIKVIKDSSGNSTGVEVGKIPLPGINDFESLYSDPDQKALVMICKNCSTDDNKSVSAYAFYPDSIGFGEGPVKPLYVLNAGLIEELSPFKTSKFQPSGAAINPKMKKLFIISSASHQLVVADLRGNPESVHKLSPGMFLQPEGIAFKQGGDLYISNEGLGANATMLKFTYNRADDSISARKARIGYDFELPDEKMELGKHLKEISGMAYVKDKNVILTENDEKGDIYTIDFANKKDLVNKVKFGGKDDYEDIVYTDTAIYMLVSSGSIIQVNTKDESYSTREFKLGIDKSEFEAMYLDEKEQSLILLCKDCSKEKDQIRAAYKFDLRTNTFMEGPVYVISINSIKQRLGDDKAEFKPSAAGINPKDGKIYIVASVGKLLVVTNKIGEIEEVFRLDPALYNQPEGLTFAPNGDLYISNEGGEGVATILKFNYRK